MQKLHAYHTPHAYHSCLYFTVFPYTESNFQLSNVNNWEKGKQRPLLEKSVKEFCHERKQRLVLGPQLLPLKKNLGAENTPDLGVKKPKSGESHTSSVAGESLYMKIHNENILLNFHKHTFSFFGPEQIKLSFLLSNFYTFREIRLCYWPNINFSTFLLETLYESLFVNISMKALGLPLVFIWYNWCDAWEGSHIFFSMQKNEHAFLLSNLSSLRKKWVLIYSFYSHVQFSLNLQQTCKYFQTTQTHLENCFHFLVTFLSVYWWILVMKVI